MIHNITDRERSLESLVAQLSQGRDALAKRVEALEKDAARYRWLRDNPEWLGWEHDFRPDEVEREIDAAMKADQP